MSTINLGPAERIEAEQLYRAIADGETTEQLLQRFYDFAGDAADLRPPPGGAQPSPHVRLPPGAGPWLTSGFAHTTPTSAGRSP